MTDSKRHLLICSCDDTMPLDGGAVRRGCGGQPTTATELCRAELDRFRSIAAGDTPLTVGCTQEEALFSDVAAESGRADPIQFVNIRESAGWSSEAAQAGPKMAALLAAAAEPAPSVPIVNLESSGVILICGRDEVAVEAFLDRRIPFTGIPDTISKVLASTPETHPATIAEVLDADLEARERARAITASGKVQRVD